MRKGGVQSCTCNNRLIALQFKKSQELFDLKKKETDTQAEIQVIQIILGSWCH